MGPRKDVFAQLLRFVNFAILVYVFDWPGRFRNGKRSLVRVETSFIAAAGRARLAPSCAPKRRLIGHTFCFRGSLFDFSTALENKTKFRLGISNKPAFRARLAASNGPANERRAFGDAPRLPSWRWFIFPARRLVSELFSMRIDGFGAAAKGGLAHCKFAARTKWEEREAGSFSER